MNRSQDPDLCRNGDVRAVDEDVEVLVDVKRRSFGRQLVELEVREVLLQVRDAVVRWGAPVCRPESFKKSTTGAELRVSPPLERDSETNTDADDDDRRHDDQTCAADCLPRPSRLHEY